MNVDWHCMSCGHEWSDEQCEDGGWCPNPDCKHDDDLLLIVEED